MLNEYKFQKYPPAEYNHLWVNMGTEISDKAHFATCKILLNKNGKVRQGKMIYRTASGSKTVQRTVGNELFMLDIDLRSGLSGDHYRTDSDAVNLWLKGNATLIREKIYASYLILKHGIYLLHIDLDEPETITINAYVKELCYPYESKPVSLTCEESSLVRYALILMYHTLEQCSTDFDKQRMKKITVLEKRISSELKARHEEELVYIRSIGKSGK